MSNENKALPLPLPLLRDRLESLMSEAYLLASRYSNITYDKLLKKLIVSFKEGMDRFPHAEFELKDAVRAHNASSLLEFVIVDHYPSTDDTQRDKHVEEIYDCANAVTEAAMAYIDKVGDKELKYLWFTCSRCGREFPLYSYYDIHEEKRTESGLIIPEEYNKDKINTAAVYELMHGSHICDGCWQHFVCKGE